MRPKERLDGSDRWGNCVCLRGWVVRGSLAHLNNTRDVCTAVSSITHSSEVSFPNQGDCALLVLIKSIHFERKTFPNGQTASMDRLRSMATQISQISTRKSYSAARVF